MITESKWHIVYTYPNAEKKLHERLLEREVESFLPMRKALSIRRDRKKMIHLPLFASYVFVKVNNATIDKVRYTKGFACFIQFEEKLATIPENQIQMIRTVTEKDIPFALHPDSYAKEGDEVLITVGALKGQYGRVRQLKQTKNRYLVVLQIHHTGYALAVEVDRKCVSVLKKNPAETIC